MTECLIGIDAGGTMTKAAVFGLDGQELACARRKNVMQFRGPGWTERDPDAMWAAATAAIREAMEMANISPSNVVAVSMAGYGSGLYLLDRNGDPVRPGIVSTDSRAAALVGEWTASGQAATAGAMVQQRIWPGQSIALLGWLARNEPEVIDRTYRISFCKDFLRTRLCGDFSTDTTDAGIGALIDVTRSDYTSDVFDVLGLMAWMPKLPDIGRSDEVVGGVSAAAARLTGLREGTPVVRGAVDVSAAAIASGVRKPTDMSVVAGTFSINSTLHAAPRTSILPFLQCAYPLGGYIATEGAATSASNLEWTVKTLLAQTGGAAPNGDTSAIYDQINAAVARRSGQSSGIMFFPFLFGGPDGAPAGFLGMTAQNGFDEMMAAIFEGIAFAHKADIDRLLSGHDAAKPNVIKLAGGASRSSVWSDLFADVLGLPIEVPQGSELGALGVATLAASGVGAHPDLQTAVTKMTRTARHHRPQADRARPHLAKYGRYKALTTGLARAWNTSSAATNVEGIACSN